MSNETTVQFGKLAKIWCKKTLPLQVLHSNAGFYIGTWDEEGPCSRESAEYFKSESSAEQALQSGVWTQRETP